MIVISFVIEGAMTKQKEKNPNQPDEQAHPQCQNPSPLHQLSRAGNLSASTETAGR